MEGHILAQLYSTFEGLLRERERERDGVSWQKGGGRGVVRGTSYSQV
jgi:hypothetical protein